MDAAQTLFSVVSGGLSGACASAFANRIFHWRDLRTKFHPVINNIMGAYVIRFEKPEGRYWISTVGYVPLPEDEDFVHLRSDFTHELSQYNELREARELRRMFLQNTNSNHLPKGAPMTTDLMPEYQAIFRCLGIVQKKLKL